MVLSIVAQIFKVKMTSGTTEIKKHLEHGMKVVARVLEKGFEVTFYSQ